MDARITTDRDLSALVQSRTVTPSRGDALTSSAPDAPEVSSPSRRTDAPTAPAGDALSDTVTLGQVAAHALEASAPPPSRRVSCIGADEAPLTAQQAQALLGLPGATPSETFRFLNELSPDQRRQTIQEISTDVSRSTAFTSLQSHALQDSEGSASLTTLMRTCADDPEQAAALMRVQAQSATTEQGSLAIVDTQGALSRDVEAAAVMRQVATAAVETPEGSVARNDLFREASGDPRLAAAVYREVIPSSENGAGSNELAVCLRDLSTDSQSAEHFTRLQIAALNEPTGRVAVAATLQTEAVDPAVAQAARAVDTAAMQTESGCEAVTQRSQETGSDGLLSPRHEGAEGNVSSTQEGVREMPRPGPDSAGNPEVRNRETVPISSLFSESNPAPVPVRVDEPAAPPSTGPRAPIEPSGGDGPGAPAAPASTGPRAPIEPSGGDGPGAPAAPASTGPRAPIEPSGGEGPYASRRSISSRGGGEPAPVAARKAQDDGVRTTASAPYLRPFGGVSGTSGGIGAYALSVGPARQAPPPQIDVVADGSSRIARSASAAWVEPEADGGFLEAPPIAGRSRVSAMLTHVQGRSLDDVRFEPSRRVRRTEIATEDEDVTVERLEVRESTSSQAVPRTSKLEPVEAVAGFDLSDACERTCTRCGETVENRAPGCPCCQDRLREKLVSSASKIQRSGYVIGQEVDTVEVTAQARRHLDAADAVVSMRKPMAFLQMRDVLSLCSSRITGYAVARAA